MKKAVFTVLSIVLLLSLTMSAFAAAPADDSADSGGIRNGFPVVSIDTDIKLKTIFEPDIQALMENHPYDEYQDRILFYGASNFSRWTSMETDMAEYKIINNAFGGSSDVELVYYANELLFPYHPAVVFFQTGSNEYGALKGSYEERAETSLAYKRQMFAAFHEILPDAKFVVMSGLLLPGRAHFLELTQMINAGLKELADETDYIYFVDATDLTYDGENLKDELFVEDGLHLTEAGQKLWYDGYIHPAIEEVITENNLDFLRNNK